MGRRRFARAVQAGVDAALWHDFKAGQRVWVVEGYSGTVTAVEDGPFPGNEQYLVELDDGVGGGEYTSSELRPLEVTTAKTAAVDGVDGEEGEALHLASDDYPELAEILVQRSPYSIGAMKIASLQVDDEQIDMQRDAPLHEAGPVDWIADRIGDAGNYQPGHKWSYDWCRFRKNSRCMYPRKLNEQATAQAGYAVWIPEDRGYCPRHAWEAQEVCPIAEPGPNTGLPNARVDATVPWEQGGQRGVPVRISNRANSIDWHFMAAWADVQAKAKRIRQAGGVRIIANTGTAITAQVKGEASVYQTTLTFIGKQLALWECSCPWSTYSWGRSGQWKKYEGRQCAHALATLYQVQSERMFGREVAEQATTPDWATASVREALAGLGLSVTAVVHQADLAEVVDKLISRAQAEEPRVTRDLQAAAAAEAGALEGLQFRFKSPQSLTRKLMDKQRQRGLSDEQLMTAVQDVLRYTVVFDPSIYSMAAQDFHFRLQERGYRVLESENSWARGDAYSGLHFIFLSPGGLPIEVQVHTKQSYDLKNKALHRLYEEFRAASTPLRRRQELFDIMARHWDEVQIPEGALLWAKEKNYLRPAATKAPRPVSTDPALHRAPIEVMAQAWLSEGEDPNQVLGWVRALAGYTPGTQVFAKALQGGPFKARDPRGAWQTIVEIAADGTLVSNDGRRYEPGELEYPTYDPSAGLYYEGHQASLQVHAQSNGVMVALRPQEAVCEALAALGTEPVDNLHITLAYLGKADGVDRERLRQVVETFAWGAPSLEGRLGGIAVFDNSDMAAAGDVDPDEAYVLVAQPDIPGLAEWRERLVGYLADAGFVVASDHGYTPHLTLAYSATPFDDLPELPDERDLLFEDVIVAHGGEWTSYPLNGEVEIVREGARPAKQDMRLKRFSPGNYQTYDGHVTIVQNPAGWVVYETNDPNAADLFYTLRDAREAVPGFYYDDTEEDLQVRGALGELHEADVVDDAMDMLEEGWRTGEVDAASIQWYSPSEAGQAWAEAGHGIPGDELGWDHASESDADDGDDRRGRGSLAHRSGRGGGGFEQAPGRGRALGGGQRRLAARTKVSVTRAARADYGRLASDVRPAILAGVKALKNNPTPAQATAMRGLNAYRLRVGNYRVVYHYDPARNLVTVVRVGDRREAYQNPEYLRKRLKGLGALYTPEELAAYPEYVTADGYLLADLSGARPNLNPDGTVTLYHRTTETGAEGILRDRAFRSNEMGRVYFSTLTHGNATAERNDIIEVPVDPSVLHIDGIYQDEVFVWADESEVDDAAITRRFEATKRATTDHSYLSLPRLGGHLR